jgi:TolB-like protein/tRNA A-37 threonylcarbamoyl transferase component Bud32
MTSTTSRERECLACMTPLPEEAHFCLHCGAPTPTDPDSPPRTTGAHDMGELAKVKKALTGRYDIERALGAGGMATVYLATDVKHRRKVAVKVMRPELADTVGAERFLREVEIAAALTHPNILPVYDSGRAGGILYYVMPLVEGESLQEKLARNPQLPIEEALQLCTEVIEALAYAHERGIIHRDIKPANIMLARGHALVADFGIARAMGGEASITKTGLAVGTPQYMSPEQATGAGAVDGRADLYAMGCVLYEMLVGEPPFTGPTPQAIITRSLVDKPRSLSATRATVTPALDAVVARTLAKSPADRYQTAEALRTALRSTLSSPSSPSAPSRRRFSWKAAVLALAALAVLVTGLILKGTGAAAGDVVRLAVLPFENRGAPDDGYFVDGVADQVRGKLMSVAGFQIIARASSDRYRAAKKTPQEIGRELNVDYLLTSTVTWVKSADGKSRVQVVPELIDVRTGAASWQQSFDAELTDIFQVQGTIASQVAGALNVALAPAEETRLAARPTQSLDAYDHFLKARAITSSSPAEVRRAIALYRQAVAIDSSFAEAWGELAYQNSRLYYNGTPSPETAAEARRAVDRVTALAPGSAVALAASSRYKQLVANDVSGASADGMAALQLAPNDAAMLRLASTAKQILGRWTEALAHAEAAVRVDPKGIATRSTLATVRLRMRKYPEATALFSELQAEAPSLSTLEYLAMAHLMQGDPASARRVIETHSAGASREDVVAYFGLYYDLYWMLEEADQKLLASLGPERFDGDRSNWALTMMQLYYHRGDRVRARAFADSAQMEIRKQLVAAPDDPQRNLYLGHTQALLGRKAEAIAAVERSDLLAPVEKDQITGAYIRHQIIRVYLILGENEKALDLLDRLVAVPYFLTPQYLAIDPNFAALRGNPRFERLVTGAATQAQ